MQLLVEKNNLLVCHCFDKYLSDQLQSTKDIIWLMASNVSVHCYLALLVGTCDELHNNIRVGGAGHSLTLHSYLQASWMTEYDQG